MINMQISLDRVLYLTYIRIYISTYMYKYYLFLLLMSNRAEGFVKTVLDIPIFERYGENLNRFLGAYWSVCGIIDPVHIRK